MPIFISLLCFEIHKIFQYLHGIFFEIWNKKGNVKGDKTSGNITQRKSIAA